MQIIKWLENQSGLAGEVLQYMAMQRGSTLIVSLMLVLLGPVPLSLCAAMAGLPADCVPTPHCEEMGAAPLDTVLTAPADDCCRMDSAPVPERTQTAPAPAASLDAVPQHQTPHLAQHAVIPASTTTVARSAPLDLQPVLCIFLI